MKSEKYYILLVDNKSSEVVSSEIIETSSEDEVFARVRDLMKAPYVIHIFKGEEVYKMYKEGCL